MIANIDDVCVPDTHCVCPGAVPCMGPRSLKPSPLHGLISKDPLFLGKLLRY